MSVKQEIDFGKDKHGRASVNIFLSMSFSYPAEMDDVIKALKEARVWLLKQKERESVT
jgi:hypothetical protein